MLHKSSINSISVRTQVCLITQEPKIQKPGRQQPMHQEPHGSVLVVATGHMSISLGLPCIMWTSFIAGPALVKALPHLLIAFPCLLPAHNSLSFWEVRRFHEMWEPSDTCVNLLWEVLAPIRYTTQQVTLKMFMITEIGYLISSVYCFSILLYSIIFPTSKMIWSISYWDVQFWIVLFAPLSLNYNFLYAFHSL